MLIHANELSATSHSSINRLKSALHADSERQARARALGEAAAQAAAGAFALASSLPRGVLVDSFH